MAQRLKIPHTFVIHTYTKPTKCHFCNKMLVGVYKQVSWTSYAELLRVTRLRRTAVYKYSVNSVLIPRMYPLRGEGD